MQTLEALFALIFLIGFIWFWSRIFEKAGYTGGWLWGLLLIIPVVNLIIWVWFALEEWPVQKEAVRANSEKELFSP